MTQPDKAVPSFDALQILFGIIIVAIVGAFVIGSILFIVGETVEHFTT